MQKRNGKNFKIHSKRKYKFTHFYNWSIISRQIQLFNSTMNINKESTKRRQELQVWKQKKKVNFNQTNKENDSKIISTNTQDLSEKSIKMNTNDKEIENIIIKEISQLKETVYQNLNSIERLEDLLQKYIQQPKIVHQMKKEMEQEIPSPQTTMESTTSSDHILMKKIQELESKVQTLTIEKEMWKFKSISSTDSLSLHSTILMGEDDLNESVSDQILELDKFI
jgi:hypothetical protein